MDPVDPGPAARGVPRAGRAEDEHRHAVAPRVEDCHRGVHQADVGMHHRAHHLSRSARIAVGDRDRGFLVQAEQHLRPLVAEVVDDAVVQPAVARARIEREVRNVERAQHRGDAVRAPVLLSLRHRRRHVAQDFTRHGYWPP